MSFTQKKNYIRLVSICMLMTSIIFVGCKKEGAQGPEDKYSALFKDRTWSGEFKYANKFITEPFNMTFKGDGTLIWREYSNTYGGKYTIDKNAGIITFGLNPSASQVSAKIALEGKLTDFTFNQSEWRIIHSEINNAETERQIENTAWEGITYDEDGNGRGAHFNFLTNGQVHIPAGGLGVNFESTYYYSRSSGTLRFQHDKTSGSIRVAGTLFFVFMADSSLKGYEVRQLWVNGSLNGRYLHNFTVFKQ
ncbi:hypothetical protein ACTJJ0_23570 [Chitinophaga sp. 22321]|uniref:Uncharacterized protein n=1 Tax=Chitinophaga hostae TaxID=2831022 RepID=A0ABS5J502_9BACT|nr:hypothetical protein [Chitinophaga hostae]MBS0030240.1 hypothetical protein [Chitinophaga hostae]